jgi:hypothetical protein
MALLRHTARRQKSPLSGECVAKLDRFLGMIADEV